MKKLHLAIPAVFAAAALSLSACAQAPDASTGSSAGSSTSAAGKDNSNSGEFKACMVSDSAGFNDKSFNETSSGSQQGCERSRREDRQGRVEGR